MGTQKLRWSRELRARIDECNAVNDEFHHGLRKYPYYFCLPVYLPTRTDAVRKKYFKSDFRPEWWQYREEGVVAEGWWNYRQKKTQKCRILVSYEGYLISESEAVGYDRHDGDYSYMLYKERKGSTGRDKRKGCG